MFCPFCGIKVDDGARFCPKCKSRITNDREEAQKPLTEDERNELSEIQNRQQAEPHVVSAIKRVLLWCLAGFVFLGATVEFPHYCFVFLLIASIMLAPVDVVSAFIAKRIPNKQIRTLIIIALIISGIMLSPDPEPSDTDNADTNVTSMIEMADASLSDDGTIIFDSVG